MLALNEIIRSIAFYGLKDVPFCYLNIIFIQFFNTVQDQSYSLKRRYRKNFFYIPITWNSVLINSLNREKGSYVGTRGNEEL